MKPIIRKTILSPLLAVSLCLGAAESAGAAGAAGDGSPAIMLNGERLTLSAAPVIHHGTTFVPIRGIFEKQGAEVVWDAAANAVRITKAGDRFTYVVGTPVADWNGEKLALPLPGYIRNGTTFVPLRLISETLGAEVAWQDGIVDILAPIAEAVVEWGVNLRTGPSTDTKVQRMLAKGEPVRVLREIGGDWLYVVAEDGTRGYISAGHKYTDYGALAAADRILEYGLTFLGTPYEFGASPKQTDTFDCSSFVKHLYGEVLGIELPRVSYDQAEEGVEVDLDELRKGDLLFFKARGLPIGHVAVYAGDGKLLHTYSEKVGVELGEFDEKWKKRFVVAKRVL